MTQAIARIVEPAGQVFVATAIADADIQSYSAVEMPVLAYHEDGISSVQWQWTDGTATVTVSSTAPETIAKYTGLDANVAGNVGGKDLRWKAWGFTKTADLTSLTNGQITLTVTVTPGGTGNTARVLTQTHYKKASVIGPYYVSPTGNDANDGLSTSTPVKEILKAAKLAYTAGGSDSSGALIYLMDGTHDPGDYAWGTYTYIQAKTGFLTIANRAANASPATIAKTGSNWSVSDQLNWCRFVGIECNNSFVDMANNATYGNKIWFQGCELYSTGRHATPNAAGWFDNYNDEVYVTECYFHDTNEAAKNGSGIDVVRNMYAQNIGGDVCFGPKVALNVEGTACYATSGTEHSDLVQFQNANPISNVVICSLRLTNSKCQHLFYSTSSEATETVTDVAIVNVAGHFDENLTGAVAGVAHSQWDGKEFADPTGGMRITHLVTAFTSLTGKSESDTPIGYIYDVDTANCSGFWVKNNAWGTLTSGKTNEAGLAGLGAWDQNRFLSATSLQPGTNTSQGTMGFTDITNADLRPASGSALKGSGVALPDCFSPPGSDGVGTTTAPNMGAWGDAAGAGLSGGTYTAGGTTVITDGSISWTLSGTLTTGQFVSGGYWVLDPGSGVTVTAVSPAPSTNGSGQKINRSMKNPSPVSGSWKQAYDEKGYDYDATLEATLPISLAAGDVLVSSDSTDNYVGGTVRGYSASSSAYPDYWGGNASVGVTRCVEQMRALHVVSAVPSSTQFRPPSVGSASDWGGTRPTLDPGALDPSALSWIPNYSTTGVTKPTHASSWTDTTNIDKIIQHARNPVFGTLYWDHSYSVMPTGFGGCYNREILLYIQEALALLCFSISNTDKKLLLEGIVQRGLDEYWNGKLAKAAHAYSKLCMGIAWKVTGYSDLSSFWTTNKTTDGYPGGTTDHPHPTVYRQNYHIYYVDSDKNSTINSVVYNNTQSWAAQVSATSNKAAWRLSPSSATLEHEHLDPTTEWPDLNNPPTSYSGGGCKMEDYRNINSPHEVGGRILAYVLGLKSWENKQSSFDYVDRWMTEDTTTGTLDTKISGACTGGSNPPVSNRYPLTTREKPIDWIYSNHWVAGGGGGGGGGGTLVQEISMRRARRDID